MTRSTLYLPDFLVIGSSSRNAGKTSFSRNLIETFPGTLQAVKITVISKEHRCPHGDGGCGVCSSLHASYEITEETVREGHKDTSKLLKAGASRVYWLRVSREAVPEGLEALLSILDPKLPVLCESNSIVRTVKPGLYIQLRPRGRKGMKQSAADLSEKADIIIETTPEGADFDFSRLCHTPEGWSIKKT
ncbi:MAG: hypothetical protein JXR86_11900 [Spirochaetales bacterium]|nr:hypothetical protein [Spirochaetales bacterium]